MTKQLKQIGFIGLGSMKFPRFEELARIRLTDEEVSK
jgi:hypothetical protein